MQKIVNTKTIEIEVYQAYDGTIFKEEDECIKYEETARAVIEKAFRGIMVDKEPFTECQIWENFGYGSEEYEMAVIDIKDESDLEIANKYYAYHKANNLIGKEYIGKRVLVSIGYCYDGIKYTEPYPRTKEDLIKQFEKDINKFFEPKINDKEDK